MKKNHEKLLLATLAGLVIAAAAAFAITPAMASGYHVNAEAEVTGVEHWDVLNVRKWPAPHSKKIGELEPWTVVWVERCIEADYGSDWCLVDDDYGTRGWVNSKYLALDDDYADAGY
jgi:uncharacterized protein YraI